MSAKRQRGSRENGTTKDVVIRCRIKKELSDQIDSYCREKEVTKTDVIIEGIKKVIEK